MSTIQRRQFPHNGFSASARTGGVEDKLRHVAVTCLSLEIEHGLKQTKTGAFENRFMPELRKQLEFKQEVIIMAHYNQAGREALCQ